MPRRSGPKKRLRPPSLRANSQSGRRLRFEPLEDRRVLSITVNTLVDENNGVAVGGISLRDAIAAAAPGDTINFASSLTSSGPATILLTNGELLIDKSLTINGPGATRLTIDASGNKPPNPSPFDSAWSRVIEIDDQASALKNVSISGLTLAGGGANGDGGGILNQESLQLNDITILGNRANGRGGGVASFGPLTIVSSRVISNGTGNFFFILNGNNGGGIYASAALSIQFTQIDRNDTQNSGGGVYVDSFNVMTPAASITNSTISHNSAGNDGGGLSLADGRGLNIISSTINNNSAEKRGGGIFSLPDCKLAISSSTITGNSSNTNGGGLYAGGGFPFTTIQHSTIDHNGAAGFGGGIFLPDGELTIDHTIVAMNTANHGADITGLLGSVFNATYSLIGSSDQSGLVETTPGIPGFRGSYVGGPVHGLLDPKLGDLADNGGPVLTQAPLAGSPAIDAGNAAAIAGGGAIPLNDSRGAPFTRVAGGRIDIGAVERQTIGGLNLIVDTLADESDGNYSAGDLSLREALGLANGSIGSNTITFAPSLTSAQPARISLVFGGLFITDSLTLTGPAADRLKIAASPLAQGNLIAINDFNSNIPAIFVQISGLSFSGTIANFDQDAAINNSEELTLTNCTISGNTSRGITNNYHLTVIGCTISNNDAVYTSGGGLLNIGTATIDRTTIAGNSSFGSGGGVFNDGILNLTGSMISGNSANASGGGIYSRSGLTVSNSTISGNMSGGNGGGIAVSTNLPVSIKYSTITLNVAQNSIYFSGSGGGISNTGYVTAPISVKNTIIAGNAQGPSVFLRDDVAGPITLQYSFLGINSGATVTDNGNNQIGTLALPLNPQLGPLTSNGGPTLTHALLPGSLARNAGDPAAIAGASGVPQYDQRGTPWSRVAGGRIDIGAFESQPNPLPGDYNFNGVVDAADYVVWRKTSGATNDLRADGNTNGIIDQGDYNLWRAHFGQVLAVGSAAEVTGASLGSMSSAVNSDMPSTVVTTSEATSDLRLSVRTFQIGQVESAAKSLHICANADTSESPSDSANDDALLAYLDSLEKHPHASRAQCDASPRAAGTQTSTNDVLSGFPTSRLRAFA
jgi:hypothetical protein